MEISTSSGERPWLDAERCYRAVSSRDERFDGWFFVAVHTTGIYCRPSCPARTPHRHNVEFLPTSASAQQRGFRACKRCRPDAAPGSPEWDTRADVAARAMRLIADGVVDRNGVPGLAGRLGYSARHLNRLLLDEVGAGPLALARSQRAHTARVLIETTDVAVTDIAFAAGFSSVRQFNDTIRAVYALSPTEMRRLARRRHADRGRGDASQDHGRDRAGTSQPAVATVRLAARAPFAADALLEFLGARAIPGVEHWDGSVYRRSLRLPHGHAVATVVVDRDGSNRGDRVGRDRGDRDGGNRGDGDGSGDPGACGVRVSFRLAHWRDLAPAVQRMRRLLDLDADPHAVDSVLGADPVLGPWVAAMPGRRVAGSVDPVETAVRAVVGQQISIAGARTVAGRLVEAVGEPLAVTDDVLTHVFPSADALADIDDAHLPMPSSRRSTLRTLTRSVVDGTLGLDEGTDRGEAYERLVALPGIGPWTAGYIVMRGLHDPDVFLDTDLGVRHALAASGLGPDAAERWRPWRSYALHHLWASLPAATTNHTGRRDATAARPPARPRAATTATTTTTRQREPVR